MARGGVSTGVSAPRRAQAGVAEVIRPRVRFPELCSVLLRKEER